MAGGIGSQQQMTAAANEKKAQKQNELTYEQQQLLEMEETQSLAYLEETAEERAERERKEQREEDDLVDRMADFRLIDIQRPDGTMRREEDYEMIIRLYGCYWGGINWDYLNERELLEVDRRRQIIKAHRAALRAKGLDPGEIYEWPEGTAFSPAFWKERHWWWGPYNLDMKPKQ